MPHPRFHGNRAAAATAATRPDKIRLLSGHGEMAEWSNAADSKSVVPIGYRGFESLSLRHTV
jgi:hypothetical protein